MNVPVIFFLGLSTLLFFIGVFGFVTRRNLIVMLISIELVLNAVDLNFAVFNRLLYPGQFEGFFFTLFSIAVSAVETAVALAIIICILTLLAIFMWFFYYRHGHTTELWLPKSTARFITTRARQTRSNTEAFSLGILTCILELPISAVLLVLAASSILALPDVWQLLAILVYTLVTITPLFVMQLAFRRGKTVVDAQRWRLQNKNFLRIISGIGFLVLAIFIFTFEVLV